MSMYPTEDKSIKYIPSAERLIARLDKRLHEDTISGKEKLIGPILSLSRGKNVTKQILFDLIRAYY